MHRKRTASVEILRICCCNMAGIWGGWQGESVGYGYDAKEAGIDPNHTNPDMLKNLHYVIW